MATIRPVHLIEVRSWDQRVGALALDPATRHYVFEYDKRWVQTGVELAPLQMPLSKASQPFSFPDLSETTYRRLPAMIADALPDKFGNALINAYMAERGMSIDEITMLDRLAYMGRRAMGALTFRPSRGPATSTATAVVLGKLVNQARTVLNGDLADDDHAAAALRQIIQVGTSAGGLRAKAVIAWNPETKEIRAGQFDIPEGFEAWLLKFDGVGEDTQLGPSKSYGRIEYVYSQMAEHAGIDMAECRLLEENGRAHFMTRRFDRGHGNTRHHMQSLCAMAHLDFNQAATHSYNQLLQTIEALKIGDDAMVEAFRRMVFNIVAANCDDHTKNTAFLLRQGGSWELAPAYDITHAYKPESEWVSQHQMSINGKFHDIRLDDVRAVAERFGLMAHLKPVVKRVRDAVSNWRMLATNAGVLQEEIELIEHHIAERLKRLNS